MEFPADQSVVSVAEVFESKQYSNFKFPQTNHHMDSLNAFRDSIDQFDVKEIDLKPRTPTPTPKVKMVRN